MPLVLDIRTAEQARLGVWSITEPVSFFAERLQLSAQEQVLVTSLNALKRMEWLASRFVLDQILDHTERIETSTLPSGKPYLIGRQEQISLSHSDDYVAAMMGHADVGIDIQRCKDKILELEHKFANPEESARIDRTQAMLHLHVLWGAKEVLYKIYAKKRLRFTSHLFVDLPTLLTEQGQFGGTIRTQDEELPCTLCHLILENYVLVYGQRIS